MKKPVITLICTCGHSFTSDDKHDYAKCLPVINPKDLPEQDQLTSTCFELNGVRYYSKLVKKFVTSDSMKSTYRLIGKEIVDVQIGEFDFNSPWPEFNPNPNISHIQ